MEHVIEKKLTYSYIKSTVKENACTYMPSFIKKKSMLKAHFSTVPDIELFVPLHCFMQQTAVSSSNSNLE